MLMVGGIYDDGMDMRSVVCDVFRGDDEKDGCIVLYSDPRDGADSSLCLSWASLFVVKEGGRLFG